MTSNGTRQTHTDAANGRHRVGEGTPRRTVLGTSLPGWLVLGLIAVGLPRTLLTDLGVVEPEGSWVYYVLALTPFAAWFVVALLWRSRTPIRDHLVTGTLYGFSLIVVHEALWSVSSSLGHHPPESAVRLADQYDSPLRELVLHGYTAGIAMMIGLGVGLTAAVVAVVANKVRARRRSSA